MSFVIQSGITRAITGRGRKPTQFPLSSMNVGDSFLMECDISKTAEVESWRRKLRVAAKRYAEQNGDGYKFETAVVSETSDNEDEDGNPIVVTGVRVWRAA